MPVRAMISVDIIKEERLYHVLIPNGAPFKEARDVLQEVIAMLDKQEQDDREKAAQQESPAAEPVQDIPVVA